MTTPSRGNEAVRGLAQVAWRQALWAIPFALFFGLLTDSGRGLPVYIMALKCSLVFSYAIGLALWSVRYFVQPHLVRGAAAVSVERSLRVGGAYVAAAIVGSYLGAFVIHHTLLPGFMGSPRAVLISGMFTLLFSALFAGFNFAYVFYHHAVDRARAVETIRAELASAELRALRAQVNPHFLFNSLNTIAALVRIDPAAAEDTITRLADVFRYTLRASDDTHQRLGDELAFLREYLAIERTRFADRLRVVEAVEPGLEDLEVPGLLLQPLVENAVRYAVSPRGEGATLRLGARRDGDLLRLVVADDGPGMSVQAGESGNGFGLHSVRERLRAAGPPHALHIRTGPDRGTEIEIVLPAIPGPARPSHPTPATGERSCSAAP